ncbi:MAG TPA: DUF2892 domain-containing protein [Bacteroidia bacterium]|nr:DUF2892 domain-containing protein [Bacteroidia bacterium]
MKKNLGKTDRMVRVLLGVLLGIVYFTGIIQGTLATVALVLSVVMFVTSAVSFCPIYAMLGLSTGSAEKA